HGAAVEHNESVTALVGRTRSGKSTLGVRLALEAGCAFLSDEYCPVRLTDGVVEPFPRCLGLRRDTRALLVKCGALAEAGAEVDVDPEAIARLKIGSGGPLRNIVLVSGEGVGSSR